jgi:hypothetical protein
MTPTDRSNDSTKRSSHTSTSSACPDDHSVIRLVKAVSQNDAMHGLTEQTSAGTVSADLVIPMSTAGEPSLVFPHYAPGTTTTYRRGLGVDVE